MDGQLLSWLDALPGNADPGGYLVGVGAIGKDLSCVLAGSPVPGGFAGCDPGSVGQRAGRVQIQEEIVGPNPPIAEEFWEIWVSPQGN